MPRQPRSLLSNSVGSVIASGMLIFSTVLIPAILARALTRGEFDAYSFVFAALPLMVMVPQSLRTVAATQLALASSRFGEAGALTGYRRFVGSATLVQLVIATVAIEAYVTVSHTAETTTRFGLYALLGYAIGLVAIGFYRLSCRGPSGFQAGQSGEVVAGSVPAYRRRDRLGDRSC